MYDIENGTYNSKLNFYELIFYVLPCLIVFNNVNKKCKC